MSSKTSSLIVLAAASIAQPFGLAGCNKTGQDNTAQNQPAPTDQSQDPAATANLAPTDGTQATEPASQPVQQTDQQPAPAAQQNYQQPPRRRRSVNLRNSGACQPCDNGYQDTNYGQPVLQAQDPPPPLPEYSQPQCPGNGYHWTPGYWSYAPQGYYWVPGAWAWPPQVGFLWTPGYWGFF